MCFCEWSMEVQQILTGNFCQIYIYLIFSSNCDLDFVIEVQ